MDKKKITIEELYSAIVRRILQADDRFKATPYELVRTVCNEEFDCDFDSTGIDDFDIFNLIIECASRNGYSTRAVPVKGEKWGLPYNFEYFFYPETKGKAKGKEKSNKDVIILSRMYVGSYLEDNIGHEVINLFRSDNGENYVYVNEDGKINPQYNDSVRAVLLVKYAEKGVMEVVAKAEELEQVLYKTGNAIEESASQVKYVDDNRITYGGVPIYRIHNDTAEEKITITFKTNRLRLPVKPIYLIEDEDKTDAYESFVLLPEKHFSSQSLKMYYSVDSLPGDFMALEKLLSDDKLWEDDNTTNKIDINDYSALMRGNSFLSIIKKEYDELVFSNMLAHFFEQNRSVFLEFVTRILGINGFSKEFQIVRESNHNIDLWIEDEHNVIVIENKIKSKINGEQHDLYGDKVQSQLKKYYDNAVTDRPNKDIHCYIFSPDYNFINLSKYAAGEHYELIKYSQIYSYYHEKAGEMLRVGYFKEFLEALEIHSKTVDSSNFDVMKERFITKIRRIQGFD